MSKTIQGLQEIAVDLIFNSKKKNCELELITINKTHNELRHQLEFLIRKEFSITYKKYFSYPVFLIIWTILFISLLLFTGVNNFITLKAITTILTIIFWLFSLIIFTVITIQYFKREIWKRKSVKIELLNKAQCEFGFDDEKLYYTNGNFSSDISWEHFKFYAIKKTHLFLIPAHNIYESACVSESEIGVANFKKLKAIVCHKLVEFT